MEHNDDFKEEVCTTKKEKEHLHRMWILTKRENVNLIEQLKNLEYEACINTYAYRNTIWFQIHFTKCLFTMEILEI